MKITSAIITPMPRPMPLGMFDPMPEVVATFEDGSSKSLFTFYPDEISFRASEFIGLTEQESHALKQRKDIAYVLCPGWSGGHHRRHLAYCMYLHVLVLFVFGTST